MKLWIKVRIRLVAALLLGGAVVTTAGQALSFEVKGSPFFAEQVKSGALPPVSERVPAEPSIVNLEQLALSKGRFGGTLRMLMGRAKDIRMMTVYGYARLICYDTDFKLQPDILRSVEVKDGRIFTFKLRKSHRWSDGHPFTTEDFRYFWEDMALDKVISPLGPPSVFLIDDQLAKFEVIDEHTVRYSWNKPNPYFLSALAGARPLYVYRPAHYLKQFHANYVGESELAEKVKKGKKRNWRALHYSKDRPYRNDNPELPALQPWINTTSPPSERFMFRRNPYYHRVDSAGLQLPYIDEVAVSIASARLIPAKVGTGEADLQARSLEFKNYTFLKRGEKRNMYNVFLWSSGRGSQLALYPNLNASDPVWRKLLRMVDFRRALSLAIDRDQINQVVFYGLGKPGNNTLLPQSPLFKEDYRTNFATFDPKQANAILDKIGLAKRDDEGFRLMPDGRVIEIIVETAGEDSEQADVLELIRTTWKDAGVKLFTKPSRREVLRQRVKAGQTVMSVFYGLDNGIATADFSPNEFVPTNEDQLQWPLWGRYIATGGKAGEKPDIAEGKRLVELYKIWRESQDTASREEAWREILDIHKEEMFSIGVVSGVPQPVVVSDRLRNVPEKGLYNWDPGAHFGIYRPDVFYFSAK
ncbi:MAG: ABC transporter substrate-binding protein [Hyphomicrobiaceae bacterium]